MRRNLVFLIVIGLLAAPALAGPPEPDPVVVVEGQVFDRIGDAVARVPVRLLMTRRVLEVADFSLREDFAEGPSTTTDAAGFFRLEFRPDPDYDYFYLRFYDADRFDAVRYAPPDDEDITSAARNARPVIVQRRLADAPDWPAVVREVQRVGGPDTPRGRILRTLGLPDAVVPLEGGRSEWRFERAGVRYVLQAGEVLERATLPRAPAAVSP